MFTRTICFMAIRIGLSAILLAAPIWNVAAADVLVLRNGGRIEGTLANSEVVARDPFSFHYIAFLQMPANRAPELLSFAVADVEYVLLESDVGSRVIDFQLRPRATTGFRVPGPAQPMPVVSGPSDRSKGIALILFGVGVEALAIAHPFETNWYYSGSTRVNTGNTYNASNYVLMGVGGLCIIGGFQMLRDSRRQEHQSFSPWALPGGAGLRKSWKF